MPKDERMVINTGPLLALIAALGNLSILDRLYDHVIVPSIVVQEVLAGGKNGLGVGAFLEATFLETQKHPCSLDPFLCHALDAGEADVIQTAINLGIDRVCIDESVGRRIARLYGRKVTGSLGVLTKAIQAGIPIDLEHCISNMRAAGVWLSERTANQARQIIKNYSQP